MKKYLIITSILVLVGVIVFFAVQRPVLQSNLAKGLYEPRASSSDELGRKLLDVLQKGDTTALARLMPTSQEFLTLYPHMKDSAQNPNAGKFIAMFMISENRKMVNRWISRQKEMQALQFVQVKGPDTVESRGGVELWRGMKLMVKDSTGDIYDLEAFRTLVRSGDGWLLYTLIEP